MIYIMAKNNELEDTNGAFLAKNKAKLAGEADLELKLLQCFWFTHAEKNAAAIIFTDWE